IRPGHHSKLARGPQGRKPASARGRRSHASRDCLQSSQRRDRMSKRWKNSDTWKFVDRELRRYGPSWRRRGEKLLGTVRGGLRLAIDRDDHSDAAAEYIERRLEDM